eukprot:scaffold16263_cov30-Tisochrysis_lutea.AAC.1
MARALGENATESSRSCNPATGASSKSASSLSMSGYGCSSVDIFLRTALSLDFLLLPPTTSPSQKDTREVPTPLVDPFAPWTASLPEVVAGFPSGPPSVLKKRYGTWRAPDQH